MTRAGFRSPRCTDILFELILALRYLSEGREQALLIRTGVGVSVIISLSALSSGRQTSPITRALGTQPHVVVRPREEIPRILRAGGDAVTEARVERAAQRVRSIVQWQRARAEIAGLAGVVATAPSVAGAAIAVRGDGAD